MPKYKCFEDLPVWKNAKDLAVLIYTLTAKGTLSKDFSLRDQMRRSAISISSNIAEGFERGSKQELIQFLYIARGSCGELRSQITIAKDLGFLDNQRASKLISEAVDISKQINGFIEYLKKTNIRGDKFK
jgi:four helix bundle protein